MSHPIHDASSAAHELERAGYIANADHWPGNRAERVADVQTQELRAIACGIIATAAALEALADIAERYLPSVTDAIRDAGRV